MHHAFATLIIYFLQSNLCGKPHRYFLFVRVLVWLETRTQETKTLNHTWYFNPQRETNFVYRHVSIVVKTLKRFTSARYCLGAEFWSIAPSLTMCFVSPIFRRKCFVFSVQCNILAGRSLCILAMLQCKYMQSMYCKGKYLAFALLKIYLQFG